MKKIQKRSRLAEPCPYVSSIKNRIKTDLTLSIGVIVAIILFSLFFKQPAYPQSLAIGDKLPAVRLTNVIHNSSHEITLTNDKLIIIDFWATWCSPCLAMLPKADSLQHVFGKEVQFIPVTYQNEADVNKLLSRSKKIGKLSLPFVIGDTLLRKYFPHKELPHYVWIDHGVVKAITDHHAVTAENISAMLSASKPTLGEKKDVLIRYNRDEPLLLNNLGVKKEDIRYEMVMSRYIDGLPSRQDVIVNDNGSIRITLVNASVAMFACLAYSNGNTFYGNNRVMLEVKAPELVTTAREDKAYLSQWVHENTACYEIIVPATMATNVYQFMQQDVAKLFPQYTITVEKRKRSCLALLRTSDSDKIKTSGKKQSFTFDHFGASMTNCSLNLLVTELNVIDLQLLSTPVIDKTGYTQNVDLKLDATMSNVGELRKALRAYDLDLVEREEVIEVVVIGEGGR